MLSSNTLTGDWSSQYIICKDSVPEIPNSVDYYVIAENGVRMVIEEIMENRESNRFMDVVVTKRDPASGSVHR